MKLCASADLHLREDMPFCRNDEDWMEVQRKAVRFVVDYANEHGANIAISGDLLHRSYVHPSVISMFLQEIGRYDVPDGKVGILAGQHDLLHHNLNNMDKVSFCNLWTLALQKRTPLVDLAELGTRLHFGEIEKRQLEHSDDCALGIGGDCDCAAYSEELVFLHQLVFESEGKMPPGKGKMYAEQVANIFAESKYICLGDNHRHFLWIRHHQRVINPGCLIRQSSDLIDYKAGFYFVDTDLGLVKFVEVPDSGSISNEHILKEKERDNRLESFVAMIEQGQKVSLDFVENLKSRMEPLDVSVREVIENLLEEVHGDRR
jgi:hypothetical protein